VNARRLGAIALASAVTGTLLDRVQTFSGVLAYAKPDLWGESYFVPPIMAGAGVAMAVAPALFRKRFKQDPVGATGAVGWAAGDFTAAYVASGLLVASPIALLVGYTVLATFRLLRDRRPARVATALTAMVLGVLGEYGLTQVGFFSYLHPNIAGMPYSIGGLYVFAGLVGSAVENRWPVLATSVGAPVNP
jgi:hypothetical protein